MPKCRFLPPGVSGLEIAGALVGQGGLVRRAEIRRAAEEPGDVLREHVQHLAGCLAPRDAFRVGRKDGEIAVPTGREFAPLHLVDFRRQVRDTCARYAAKSSVQSRRASAPRAPDAAGEVLVDAVGHEELRVLGPAVVALGEADFFLAERFAVGCGGVLLVRRAVADVAVENDERGPAFGLAEDLERVLDAIDVVGVADPQHVPAVGEESGGDIFGEGDAGVAFDGDVVVVVDPAEVIEAQMAGQRGRFRRNALHHAAIAADGVDVVVEDRRSPVRL